MTITVDVNPTAEALLKTLSNVAGVSVPDIVRRAIAEYLGRASLASTDQVALSPEDLAAYRLSDPNFEGAIARFVEAEATAGFDPAEGVHSPGTERG